MLHLPNAIFALISPEQRQALLPDLINKKISLLCKSAANEGLYTLNPFNLEDGQFLICEKGNEPIPFTGLEKVIVSFDFNDEKYFMYTSVLPLANSLWKMEAKLDVFKLQRRQSFRINIPPTYKSKAVFKDPRTEKEISVGVLTDISSGGCKVLVEGFSTLTSQQAPLIEIFIGRRDPITLACEVRHVQKITDPRPQESLGIMFKTVSSLVETKLFAITMELHRELTGKVSL